MPTILYIYIYIYICVCVCVNILSMIYVIEEFGVKNIL